MAARFAHSTEMACRTTFLDDALFGGAFPAVDIDAEGRVITDREAATEIPVLLFEPAQPMVFKDTTTGSVYEARTEMLISAGLNRLAGPVMKIETAGGWGVVRTADKKVLLRDPDGAVVASGTPDLAPEWVSAAISYGYILVLHGAPLGVRVPPGRSEESYSARERASEFKRARNNGLLVGAFIAWRGLAEEALDWILFPPGAFDQPFPLAFVPQWEFNAHGGPEPFGFVRLSDSNLPPLAQGLVARLTDTDLDLFRDDDPDQHSGFVCGYHAGDEPRDRAAFDAWRQAACACGGLVVMAGNRPMPAVLGASAEQDEQVNRAAASSWVAKVPLTDPADGEQAQHNSGIQHRQTRDAIQDAEQQAEYTTLLSEKIAAQDSFKVYWSNALSELIDMTEIQRWITNLWPVACQTCAEPLGTKVDISADGPLADGKILLSMHHSACRPSGITPQDGVRMCAPTTSLLAGYIGGASDGTPGRDDIPVMVINPSCEQIQLRPGPDGQWRNATLDAFAVLGFRPPDGQFPSTLHDLEVEIVDGYLLITVTGYLPDTVEHEWAIEPPAHILEQVRRLRGLAISLVTKALPTRLGVEDLPSAFTDPEALIGWARFEEPS